MSAETSPIIVTDSACDLPPALYDAYDIRVIPHTVQIGDQTFASGVDITTDELLTHMTDGTEPPTTAHPTQDTFRDFYARLDPDRPVLSLHISLGLSSTLAAARWAALALPDRAITVWDSQSISAGQGLQVLTAARAAQAGYTVPQILTLLEDARRDAYFLFCLDDLTPLVRSGRIGRVSYHVAQTLRLKPIITVSKSGDTVGTYVSTTERPRSMGGAVRSLVRDMVRMIGADVPVRALVIYGDEAMRSLAEDLIDQIHESFRPLYLEASQTTPVLAAHVGPRALGVGYIAGEWPV